MNEAPGSRFESKLVQHSNKVNIWKSDNLVFEWSISAGTSHPNTRPFSLAILLQQFKIGLNGPFFELPFENQFRNWMSVWFLVWFVLFCSYTAVNLKIEPFGYWNQKAFGSSYGLDFGFWYSDVDCILVHF